MTTTNDERNGAALIATAAKAVAFSLMVLGAAELAGATARGFSSAGVLPHLAAFTCAAIGVANYLLLPHGVQRSTFLLHVVNGCGVVMMTISTAWLEERVFQVMAIGLALEAVLVFSRHLVIANDHRTAM